MTFQTKSHQKRKKISSSLGLGIVCFFCFSSSAFSNIDQDLLNAIQQGNIILMERALNKGADVNAKDICERTALHYALWNPQPRPQIIKLLLSHNADVNALDEHHLSPLILAVNRTNPDPQIINLLLDHHADIKITDGSGRTVLHIADILNHPQIVDLLMRHFARTSAKDGPTHIESNTQLKDQVLKFLAQNLAKSRVNDIFNRVALKKTDVTFKTIVENFKHSDTPPPANQLRPYAIQAMNGVLYDYELAPIDERLDFRDQDSFNKAFIDAWVRLTYEQQKRLGHHQKFEDLRNEIKTEVENSLSYGVIPIPFVPSKSENYDPFGYTQLSHYLFLGIAPVTVSEEEEETLRLKNIHPIRPTFLASASELTEHDLQHAELMSGVFWKLGLRYKSGFRSWKQCFDGIANASNDPTERKRTKIALFYHLHEDFLGFLNSHFVYYTDLNFHEFVLERLMQEKNSEFSIEALLGNECSSQEEKNNLQLLAGALFAEQGIPYIHNMSDTRLLKNGFTRTLDKEDSDILKYGLLLKLEYACNAQEKNSSQKSNKPSTANESNRNLLVQKFNDAYNQWHRTMEFIDEKFYTLEVCEEARKSRFHRY